MPEQSPHDTDRPDTTRTTRSRSTSSLGQGHSVPPRQHSASTKYYDIATSILSNDVDEIFLGAARDGEYEKIEHMLQRRGNMDISIDVKDKRTGNTPLMWAAKKGHSKIVQLLLKHGADPTLHNYEKLSAVEMATSNIKTLLLDSVEKSCESSHSLLLQAAWQGNVKVVRKLLNQNKSLDINCMNSEKLTPLLLVARDIQLFERLSVQLNRLYDPVDVATELINHRAGVHITDSEGKTSLHYACSSRALVATQLVKMLIESGSELEFPDKRFFTPIHLASNCGNHVVMTTLLQGGSEVNSKGFLGLSPLHITAQKDHHRAAVVLLEHGADVTLTDDQGKSPLDLAKSKKMKSTLREAWTEATHNKPCPNLAPVKVPVREDRRQPGRKRGEVIFDGLMVVRPSTQQNRSVLSRQSSVLTNAEKARRAEEQMMIDTDHGMFTHMPNVKEGLKRLTGVKGGNSTILPKVSVSSSRDSNRQDGRKTSLDEDRRSVFHRRSDSDPIVTRSFTDMSGSVDQIIGQRKGNGDTPNLEDPDDEVFYSLSTRPLRTPLDREITVLNIPTTIPESLTPRDHSPLTNRVETTRRQTSRNQTATPSYLSQKSYSFLDAKLVDMETGGQGSQGSKDSSPRSDEEMALSRAGSIRVAMATPSRSLLKEEFVLEESRARDPMIQSSGSDPLSSASSLSSSPRDMHVKSGMSVSAKLPGINGRANGITGGASVKRSQTFSHRQNVRVSSQSQARVQRRFSTRRTQDTAPRLTPGDREDPSGVEGGLGQDTSLCDHHNSSGLNPGTAPRNKSRGVDNSSGMKCDCDQESTLINKSRGVDNSRGVKCDCTQDSTLINKSSFQDNNVKCGLTEGLDYNPQSKIKGGNKSSVVANSSKDLRQQNSSDKKQKQICAPNKQKSEKKVNKTNSTGVKSGSSNSAIIPGNPSKQEVKRNHSDGLDNNKSDLCNTKSDLKERDNNGDDHDNNKSNSKDNNAEENKMLNRKPCPRDFKVSFVSQSSNSGPARNPSAKSVSSSVSAISSKTVRLSQSEPPNLHDGGDGDSSNQVGGTVVNKSANQDCGTVVNKSANHNGGNKSANHHPSRNDVTSNQKDPRSVIASDPNRTKSSDQHISNKTSNSAASQKGNFSDKPKVDNGDKTQNKITEDNESPSPDNAQSNGPQGKPSSSSSSSSPPDAKPQTSSKSSSLAIKPSKTKPAFTKSPTDSKSTPAKAPITNKKQTAAKKVSSLLKVMSLGSRQASVPMVTSNSKPHPSVNQDSNPKPTVKQDCDQATLSNIEDSSRTVASGAATADSSASSHKYRLGSAASAKTEVPQPSRSASPTKMSSTKKPNHLPSRLTSAGSSKKDSARTCTVSGVQISIAETPTATSSSRNLGAKSDIKKTASSTTISRHDDATPLKHLKPESQVVRALKKKNQEVKEPLVRISVPGEEAKVRISAPGEEAKVNLSQQSCNEFLAEMHTPVIVDPFENFRVDGNRDNVEVPDDVKSDLKTKRSGVVVRSKAGGKSRPVKSARRQIPPSSATTRQSSAGRKKGGKSKGTKVDPRPKSGKVARNTSDVRPKSGKPAKRSKSGKRGKKTTIVGEEVERNDVALISGIGWQLEAQCMDSSLLQVADYICSDSDVSDIYNLSPSPPPSPLTFDLRPRYCEVKDIQQGGEGHNDFNSEEYDRVTAALHREILRNKMTTIPESPGSSLVSLTTRNNVHPDSNHGEDEKEVKVDSNRNYLHGNEQPFKEHEVKEAESEKTDDRYHDNDQSQTEEEEINEVINEILNLTSSTLTSTLRSNKGQRSANSTLTEVDRKLIQQLKQPVAGFHANATNNSSDSEEEESVVEEMTPAVRVTASKGQRSVKPEEEEESKELAKVVRRFGHLELHAGGSFRSNGKDTNHRDLSSLPLDTSHHSSKPPSGRPSSPGHRVQGRFHEIKPESGRKKEGKGDNCGGYKKSPEDAALEQLQEVVGGDTLVQSLVEVIKDGTGDLTHMVSHLSVRRGSGCSSACTSDSVTSTIDETIQWKKGNVLGKGAFGTVFCGLTNEGELIAVKQIELCSMDTEKTHREYEKVQEEVELLRNLKHQNIVGYHGTSFEGNVVSIFMQFVPGGSLANILARFGALEESVFRLYTKQILEGVEYLHHNDVIHRDIKGGNVMLMPNGIIKLIDFGCAKRLCFNLSMSQSQILKSMKGTPYWMAPEVVSETGHGKKSDIWSIGCTVFEMATRKPPWSNMNPMAAIFAIGSDRPVPELDESFSVLARQFVNACLTRDQNQRPTATELLTHPFILKKPPSRK